MKKEKFFVTTPIYYASGDLHIGHAYTSIIADAVARFKRLDGYDVLFLTGADEHGQKIERNAEKAGLTPKQFVDKIDVKFKDLWKLLNISYDKYIRTTDEAHVKLVQKVLTKLKENDDIYKSEYEGLYCVPCETFFSEAQLVNGKCPDCGRPVEKAKEESYFFKLSKYQNFIEDVFKNKENWLVPESRKNEIYKNFVEAKLTDLCVSRTTFDWGIKVPFDEKHVVYVWVDALLNYISALGYGTEDETLFKEYWPANVQFVGRDITRFHATIWPILLKALNLELPQHIHSHGWFVTNSGEKISKSKGNCMDINILSNYGVDSIRYYALKEGPIVKDVPYSTEKFLNTYNSDLANDLGNLLSRTCAMITQYFGGIVPKANSLTNEDYDLVKQSENLIKELKNLISDYRVDLCLNKIIELVRSANKYIDITTPWVLYKEQNIERLQTVMYNLYETLRVVAVCLQAFIPETAEKMFNQLGITNSELKTFDSITKFNNNLSGNVVVKGEPLFKRVKVEEELTKIENLMKNNENKGADKKVEETKQEVKKAEITIDDFDKIELKIGKVIDSVKVENSDKLLKNTVQIGNEVRTIVSGISKFYKPEDIINKNVVVVTNLKPIKLKGILSSGMILCAADDEKGLLTLVTTLKDIPSGTEVC